jgi:hypothetical protein
VPLTDISILPDVPFICSVLRASISLAPVLCRHPGLPIFFMSIVIITIIIIATIIIDPAGSVIEYA